MMKLLTVHETSEFLNIKPSTLYAWAQLGKIPHVKLNGALRFRYEEVVKWIDENSRNFKSTPPFSIQKGSKRRYNRDCQVRGPRKEGIN